MTRRPAAVYPAAALMLLAGPAAAQVAANNGGGRALDANPGVGTAGNNRVENQVDYAARNDLITGNVAGGFGFRGDVGYTAPGAFRDALGSDDLFAFRANSLGSAPVVANLPGAGGAVRRGNVVVYNDFNTATPGRAVNVPTRFAPEGGVFRAQQNFNTPNPFQSPVDAGPAAVLSNRFDTTAAVNRLGVVPTADGTALSAVTADPLRGLRRTALPTTPGTSGNPVTPNRPAPAGFDRPPTLLGPAPADGQPTLPSLTGEATTNRVSPRSLNPADAGPLGPADNPELAARPRFADATGRVRTTLQLGQLATNAVDANPATIEQRIADIQTSIFGNTPGNIPGNTPADPGTTDPLARAADGSPDPSLTPGRNPNARPAGPPTPAARASAENSYNRLLDEIREQARQRADRRLGREPVDAEARPDWMKALRDPTGEELDDAEENLQTTLERVRQNLREDAAQRAAAAAADDLPEDATDAERRQAAASRVNQLIGDLSYDVRLETLVAEREGRLNELFAQAETQMADGQFLAAERTYRQVRVEAVGNPLGRAGLVHAQLGAGMVRSAAFNLRDLFENHPELIATRYGAALLPPPDRLEWLRGELQRMIDNQSRSVEPGLMLAYLGHQVESRQLVRYGLAIAEEAAPLDPLTPVLRRIWLGEGNAPTETDTPDAGK
ncbi:MAG: hypothetical protein AAF800_01745 [Planctomycetota bacterium]